MIHISAALFVSNIDIFGTKESGGRGTFCSCHFIGNFGGLDQSLNNAMLSLALLMIGYHECRFYEQRAISTVIL